MGDCKRKGRGGAGSTAKHRAGDGPCKIDRVHGARCFACDPRASLKDIALLVEKSMHVLHGEERGNVSRRCFAESRGGRGVCDAAL